MLGFGPILSVAPYVYLACIAITLVAAITDWKTGEIPNWLTLSSIVLGPVVHGLSNGMEGLLGALLSLVVCGVIPILMFLRGGMFGGDVKLFLGIASLAGIGVGLESQLLSYMIALVYAFGRLAWEGALMRTLARTAYIAFNPILPQRLRKPIPAEMLTTLRLGGAIFAGTTLSVFSRIAAFFE